MANGNCFAITVAKLLQIFNKKKMQRNYFSNFPSVDSQWTEDNWRDLIIFFLDNNFLSSRELASLMLGHLNPSQVGTSIASNKSFQKNYTTNN